MDLKMKALAQKMNTLDNDVKVRAYELDELVQAGLLTSEEAAISLAGFAAKLREVLDAPPAGPGLDYYQLLISQAMRGQL